MLRVFSVTVEDTHQTECPPVERTLHVFSGGVKPEDIRSSLSQALCLGTAELEIIGDARYALAKAILETRRISREEPFVFQQDGQRISISPLALAHCTDPIGFDMAEH